MSANLSYMKNLLVPGLHMVAGQLSTRRNRLEVGLYEKHDINALEVVVWAGSLGQRVRDSHTFIDPRLESLRHTFLPTVKALAKRVADLYDQHDEAMRREYGM